MTTPATAPARFQSEVGPDERVTAFAWARVPRRRTAYFTEFTTAVIIDAVDIVRGWFAIRRVRGRSVEFGFPLNRRMAMAVTDQRLIIWKASPRAVRAPLHLGDVPRTRIAGARLPYVGGGWKVVELRLTDGRGVRFLADHPHAAGLVAALS
jgi:hypothetical protein